MNLGVVAHTHPAFGKSTNSEDENKDKQPQNQTPQKKSAKKEPESKSTAKAATLKKDSSSENNKTPKKADTKDVSLNANKFDLVTLRSPKPPSNPQQHDQSITSPKTARVSAQTTTTTSSTINTTNELNSQEQQQQSQTARTTTTSGSQQQKPEQKEKETRTATANDSTTISKPSTADEVSRTSTSSRALVPTPKQGTLPVSIMENLAKQNFHSTTNKTHSVLGGSPKTNVSTALIQLQRELLANQIHNNKSSTSKGQMTTTMTSNGENNSKITTLQEYFADPDEFRHMSDSRLPVVGGGVNGGTSVKILASSFHHQQQHQQQQQHNQNNNNSLLSPEMTSNNLHDRNRRRTSDQLVGAGGHSTTTSHFNPSSRNSFAVTTAGTSDQQQQNNNLSKLPPISLSKSSVIRGGSSRQHTSHAESHEAGNKLTLQQTPYPTSPISSHLIKKRKNPKHWTEMIPSFSELESTLDEFYSSGTGGGTASNNNKPTTTTSGNSHNGTSSSSSTSSGHVVPPLATELLNFIRRELKLVYAPIFEEYHQQQHHEDAPSSPSTTTNNNNNKTAHQQHHSSYSAAAAKLEQQLESVDVRLARWRVFLDAYRCLSGHFKEYGSLMFMMSREFEDMFEAIRHHISDRALFSLVANNAEEVAMTLAKETTQNVFDELALTKKTNRHLSTQFKSLQTELEQLKEKYTALKDAKVKVDNELVISLDRNKTLTEALQGEANRQNIAHGEMKHLKEENLRLQTAVKTLQEQAKKDSFLQEELFSKLDQVALSLRDAGFDVSSVMSGAGGGGGGGRKLKKLHHHNKKHASPPAFRKSKNGMFGQFDDAEQIDDFEDDDDDENEDNDHDDETDDSQGSEGNYGENNDDDGKDNHQFVQNRSQNPNTLEGMRRIGSTLHKITMAQSKKVMNQSRRKSRAPSSSTTTATSAKPKTHELENDEWMSMARRKADRRLSTVLESLTNDPTRDDEDDDEDEDQKKENEGFRRAMNQKLSASVSTPSKTRRTKSLSASPAHRIVTEARRDQNAEDRERMIRESMKFAASCAGDTAAEKLQEALLRCFAKVRKYRSSISVLRSTIDRLEKKTKKMGLTLSRQSQQNALNHSGSLAAFSPLHNIAGASSSANRRQSHVSFTNANDSGAVDVSPEHSDLYNNPTSPLLGPTTGGVPSDLSNVDSTRPLTPRPNWKKLSHLVPNFECQIDPDTGVLPSSDELLNMLCDRLKEQQSDKLKEIERKILSKRVSTWLEDERGNKTHQVKSQKASDISSVLMASSRSFVGLGTGHEVPIYLRYTGRLRNRLLGKGDVELLLKRFWKARQDSVLPVMDESTTSFNNSARAFMSPVEKGQRDLTNRQHDDSLTLGSPTNQQQRGDLAVDLAHGASLDRQRLSFDQNNDNNNNNNNISLAPTKRKTSLSSGNDDLFERRTGGFTEGSYAIPIDEFYQQWLQQTTGNPKAAIELAYSINDVCERFQHDPDCGMFLKIMRGVVSEHCLAHEMYTVEQLKRVFQDLDTSNAGILPRSLVYRVLKQLFPSKRYGDALRLRFALIPFTAEDEEGHATVRYLDLFEEDSQGNQTTFVERLRHQHFDEALEVLVEIETAVRETQQTTGMTNRQIPLWQIAHSIRNVDARMPTNAIVHILVVGAQMAPSVVQQALDRHDSQVEIDVELFFRRVRRGVFVRRYSPPPEDDVALLEDEADDDIDEMEDGDDAEADEKRLNLLVREEKEDEKREKAELAKLEQQEAEEAEKKKYHVMTDKEKAEKLLEQSFGLTRAQSGILSNPGDVQNPSQLSPNTQNLVDRITHQQQQPDDIVGSGSSVNNDSLVSPSVSTRQRKSLVRFATNEDETATTTTTPASTSKQGGVKNDSFGHSFAEDGDDEMLTM